MTVAEKIKISTKPLSFDRALTCLPLAIKKATTIFGIHERGICEVSVYYFTFIDGSKLTCRVYW